VSYIFLGRKYILMIKILVQGSKNIKEGELPYINFPDKESSVGEDSDDSDLEIFRVKRTSTGSIENRPIDETVGSGLPENQVWFICKLHPILLNSKIHFVIIWRLC
jgi:hypothetical protein